MLRLRLRIVESISMRPNIMYVNTLDSKHKLLLGWQGDGSWVSYDAGDRTGTGGVSKTFQQTFHIYIYIYLTLRCILQQFSNKREESLPCVSLSTDCKINSGRTFGVPKFLLLYNTVPLLPLTYTPTSSTMKSDRPPVC